MNRGSLESHVCSIHYDCVCRSIKFESYVHITDECEVVKVETEIEIVVTGYGCVRQSPTQVQIGC